MTVCHPITKAPSLEQPQLPGSSHFFFCLSCNPCKSEAPGGMKHVVYEACGGCILPQRHRPLMHGEDLSPFPVLFFLACIFSFLFYVSILLIIHECPLSLPLPLPPPLSSPVAIIEPTTTSAVSSPGQYMSPCCTPNQQRGPLPHTNLSRNPLLHLDLFQLAGWNACWVYSFIVSPLFFLICIPSFF